MPRIKWTALICFTEFHPVGLCNFEFTVKVILRGLEQSEKEKNQISKKFNIALK